MSQVTMSAAPANVIDTLNALLNAEQNSIFRYMDEGSPYLSRAHSDIRRPLADMVRAGQQRVTDLANLIDELGGLPSPPAIQNEEQYLAFLTIEFLLPKLVDAKKQLIQHYEDAMRALRVTSGDAYELMKRNAAEHRHELASLQAKAA